MNIEIAKRIIALRKDKGLTQTEFAERLNTTRPKIAAYELNRVNFDSAFLDYICKTFNVSYEWLIMGEGNMYVHTVDTFVERFAAESGISHYVKCFIKCYLKLDPEQRKVLDGVLSSLADMWSNAPDEADSLNVVKAIDMTIEREQGEAQDNVVAEKTAFMKMAEEAFDSEKKQVSQALSVKESGAG